VRAGEKVSDKARALLSYNIAPIGTYDLFPPRVYVAHALLYPMEPRVHHNILHETGWLNIAWNFNQNQPDLSPVTAKVVYDVAKAFWGSEEAGDFSSYEGKALAAKKVQNRAYNRDSLGLCDFAWPITYSFNTPDHVGDPDLEAKIFTAATGIAGEDLDRYGERIFNLQRVIMLREGRKVPEDDFPPEYNFTEPLPAITNFEKMTVLGPGGKAVSAAGKVLDRNRFTSMLKEYYRLRGWDEETGLPRPETLTALGLLT
jgi:aldehyde:ferredoxin oxidoreductase